MWELQSKGWERRWRGDTSSYKLSENPVIQSWFRTASLPVRFWRSKFLRPVAPKSVTPPLAQNSSLTLLTPRKPRETTHFTHLLHKTHFRTSPAKTRDVIRSRPHQIKLQYLARPPPPRREPPFSNRQSNSSSSASLRSGRLLRCPAPHAEAAYACDVNDRRTVAGPVFSEAYGRTLSLLLWRENNYDFKDRETGRTEGRSLWPCILGIGRSKF